MRVTPSAGLPAHHALAPIPVAVVCPDLWVRAALSALRASLGRNLIVTLSMCADTVIDLSVAWHLGAPRLTVRDHIPGLPHRRPPAQEGHGRGLPFSNWSTRGTTCRCEDGTLGPDLLTPGGVVLKTRPTFHSAGEDGQSVMDAYAGTAVRARPQAGGDGG